jgi:ParB family chromosome partitioning protein
MSVTKSKANAVKKASGKKSEIAASAQELVNVLDKADVRYAAYSDLFIGEKNARIIPHTAEEIQGYADSIEGVGLLQNIVVVESEDGRQEVVCGAGRTKAIGLLVQAGKVDPDSKWIPFKSVPRHLARAASLTENGKHKQMHPAEQIVGFRSLSAEGKTAAQIGDLLGYGSPHVQRMLKLANLAPDIIDALATDELTTEHCHALALDADHERQREVLEQAKSSSWNGSVSASKIKDLMTSGEASTSNSTKFDFVGGEAAFDETEIRRDLFSDEQGGYVDAVKLNSKVLEKLTQIAEGIKSDEGWSWCETRQVQIYWHGDDAKNYSLEQSRKASFTEVESARIDVLSQIVEQSSDGSDEQIKAEAELSQIENEGLKRAWSDEEKSDRGVVVSWAGGHGGAYIQRGVKKKTDELKVQEAAAAEAEKQAKTKPVDTISAPLLTKMSSERTLAVQAALMQQREKAVALMTWTLCTDVFAYCVSTRHPFTLRAKVSYSLTDNAPSGESGAAWLALEAERKRLKKLLPDNWEKDFTTFFTLDGDTLMALMAFCTACSVDGVQTRTNGHTTDSYLDSLEDAIGFHMRDWWQPTTDNFFIHLKTSQIIAAMNDAGQTGAASDADKMKKRDAADHAAFHLKDTCWVPDWMLSPKACDNKAADKAENKATVTHLTATGSESDSTSSHSPAAAA